MRNYSEVIASIHNTKALISHAMTNPHHRHPGASRRLEPGIQKQRWNGSRGQAFGLPRDDNGMDASFHRYQHFNVVSTCNDAIFEIVIARKREAFRPKRDEATQFCNRKFIWVASFCFVVTLLAVLCYDYPASFHRYQHFNVVSTCNDSIELYTMMIVLLK